MKTLTEFSIINGAVTEQYSVVQDVDGEMFIQCCLDTISAGPVDTMHIAPGAAERIAMALLAGRRTVSAPIHIGIPEPEAVVVPFRMIRIEGRV